MNATIYSPQVESRIIYHTGGITTLREPEINTKKGKSKAREIFGTFCIILLFAISTFLLWSTNYGIWKLGYDRFLTLFLNPREEKIVYLNHKYNSHEYNSMERSSSFNEYITAEASIRPATVVNPQMDASMVFIYHYHTVSPGETLWNIAREFNVDIKRIVELNPQIKNPDLIFPGMKIRLIASR